MIKDLQEFHAFTLVEFWYYKMNDKTLFELLNNFYIEYFWTKQERINQLDKELEEYFRIGRELD